MHLEDMQWITRLNQMQKDPINQLEVSKSNIKNLFSDPLDGTKGFKY